MPAHCWGRYGKIAVVEIDGRQYDEGQDCPRMISKRAKGIKKIVWMRRKLHWGGNRSAMALALDEVYHLAQVLNEAASLVDNMTAGELTVT